MTNQVFLLVSLASVCGAVLVDSRGTVAKDQAVPARWQLVRVVSPSKQHQWYNYGVYAYPKYEFEYAVSDHHTGDHKRHRESRDGDHVQGEYSLVEPDGSLRRVQYSADDHTGFNAVVSKAMHKHGDNAFSFAGHTRHFLPVGHGQKSHQLFPNSTYHDLHEIKKPLKLEPVMIKTVQVPKGMKVVVIENEKPEQKTENMADTSSVSDSKEMSAALTTLKSMALPVESPSAEVPQVMTPILNEKTIPPPMTMQELMAYMMATQAKQEANGEMKTSQSEVPLANMQSGEVTPLQKVNESPPLESKPVVEAKEKEKSVAAEDSAVASSYYRSQLYYLGY